MNISEQWLSIGGIKQNILTISKCNSNPLLLIVHGGPGSPDRPLVCKYNIELAEYFTVVCWDQRCSGMSYTKQSREKPLSTELMLADLKELVKKLLKSYNQQKLYLAGHSWGAYLGLWFASEYPQYLNYYIGTGQGISSKIDETEKYNFVLKKAISANDTKIISKLLSYGEPVNGIYPNYDEEASSYVGGLIHKYGGYININNDFSENKMYSLYFKFYKHNVFKVIGGIGYSVKNLAPKVKANDIITQINKLDVPIILISGENDYICPVVTAKRWFDNLNAPQKDFIVIKNASHMVNFEQPEEWNNCVKMCLNRINKNYNND